MQLAAAYLEDGQYANVVRAGIAALQAIPRNLEAIAWLAASLLSASISYPIRGSVNWKIVGTNVASDALSHISSSGVTGGAMIIVGEDYGCDSTCVAERALPFALKSTMAVIDPRGDLDQVARMFGAGFELSEYSKMPVMYLLSTRVAT